MKMRLFSIMLSLVIITVINIHHAMGQVPPLSASVVLLDSNGNASNSFPLNDVMRAVISLENVGSESIYASSGITEEDFRLLLRFTLFHPDGTEESIPATYQTGLPDPPPPRIDPCQDDKLVQVDAVDILFPGWVWTTDPFDVLDFYRLEKAGKYRVKAILSMIRTYSEEVLRPCMGAVYAPIGSAYFEEAIASNTIDFHITVDADGDQYSIPQPYGSPPEAADCDDSNANVNPGAAEIPDNGIDDDCNPDTPDEYAMNPGTIDIKAIKYTLSWGRRPRVTKQPIEGLPIRVYDRSADSCVSTSFSPSWRHRESIWGSCNPHQAEGVTDDSGIVSLTVPPGDYLVLGMYDPDDVPQNDNEVYLGRLVRDLDSGETQKKYFWILERAEGRGLPCRHIRKTGSELIIIEPEYVEWDGPEALYPVVFESKGDWSVTTSVNLPEGFVTDHESLKEDVNTELKAVQFTLKETTKTWAPTGMAYTVTHKKKKEKIKSKIDVRLSNKLAKMNGLDRYGDKIKKSYKKHFRQWKEMDPEESYQPWKLYIKMGERR